MSNLPNFLEKISSDPALRERMQSLGTTPDSLASIAALSQECGTPVTEEELRAVLATNSEISDAELANVSGGYYGGAESFNKGLEKYYDDYVKEFGRPPPPTGY